MKLNKLVFWFLVPVVFLVLIGGFFFLIFGPTTVETEYNAAETHKAKLVRHDGIDVNFKVIIDGEPVYWSADFAPVKEDFRENLIWDKTDNIVVLEIAGERLFGYDAERKVVLTNEELLSVIFTPFWHYGFESKLPRESK